MGLRFRICRLFPAVRSKNQTEGKFIQKNFNSLIIQCLEFHHDAKAPLHSPVHDSAEDGGADYNAPVVFHLGKEFIRFRNLIPLRGIRAFTKKRIDLIKFRTQPLFSASENAFEIIFSLWPTTFPKYLMHFWNDFLTNRVGNVMCKPRLSSSAYTLKEHPYFPGAILALEVTDDCVLDHLHNLPRRNRSVQHLQIIARA